MLTNLTRPTYANSIELDIPQAKDNNDFDLLCFDGYAMGSNGIINVVMKYPKLHELTDEQINSVMEYSFGSNWVRENLNICYNDVMMVYGKVTQIQQVNTI